jgi:hypothetical protein
MFRILETIRAGSETGSGSGKVGKNYSGSSTLLNLTSKKIQKNLDFNCFVIS